MTILYASHAYDMVRDFMHLLDFIIESLDIISEDSYKANMSKWAILNTDFCVFIYVLACFCLHFTAVKRSSEDGPERADSVDNDLLIRVIAYAWKC